MFPHNSDGEPPDPPDETIDEYLEYSFLKKQSDRWQARQDARKGIPACSRKPKPTPTIKYLFNEFMKLVAEEQERWNRQAAPLRQQAAQLNSKIKDAEEGLEEAQKLRDNRPDATTVGVSNNKLEDWRQKDEIRRPDKWDPLTRLKRQLANYRTEQEELDEKIEELEEQCMKRQEQAAGYSLLRIETYCAELIRRHPYGRRLSMRIEWGLTELASTLERSNELKEILIKTRRSANK